MLRGHIRLDRRRFSCSRPPLSWSRPSTTNQSHEETETEMKPDGTGMGAEEDVEESRGGNTGTSGMSICGDRFPRLQRTNVEKRVGAHLLVEVNGPVVSISFKELVFHPSDHRLRRDHSLSFFLCHHILGAAGTTTRTVGIIRENFSSTSALQRL